MRRRAVVGTALVLVLGMGMPAATAAVTLLAVNDAASVVHDHPLVQPAPGLLVNDVGLLGGTVLLVNGPDHGSLTLGADGGFTYVPDTGFVGTDAFTYKVRSLALVTSNAAQVTVSVTNAAPVARDDVYVVTGGSLVVPPPGLLENDADADGDELLVELDGGGVSGSLDVDEDGGFRYTPGGGFDGLATFRYRVWDGHAWSAPATVTLTENAATPSPTPTPTPTPLPTPTVLPLPSLPLPSLPSLATPSPTPGSPTPPPSTPAPRQPSDEPVQANQTPPPAGSPSATPATPDPSPRPLDGSASGRSSSGGGGSPGRPPAIGQALAVRTGETDPSSGGGLNLRVGGFDPAPLWFVPAAAIGAPGLLVILWVALQVAAGAAWLPATRRLRGDGEEGRAIVRG
jgi:hypothetical protein